MPAVASAWLTDDEVAVYAQEYVRSGFQGGLNWYRTRFTGTNMEMEAFAGRRIDVPATFIGGARDWGVQQAPGARFLLVAAGNNDEEIAFNRLFAETLGSRADLWIAPQVGHTGAFARYPDEYEGRITAFFDSVLAP